MVATFTGDASVTTRSATWLSYDILQALSTVEAYVPPNAPTSFQFTNDVENYGVRLHTPYMTGFSVGAPPLITITSMTIKGTGTDPFL